MRDTDFAKLQKLVRRVCQSSPFYQKIYREAGVSAEDIRSAADFERLPLTDKYQLRDVYPLGLLSVPQRDVVRIHSSSGTTGKPIIIPYTAKDVDDWAVMFARCYQTAGITADDIIQVTPGYGLWTAGIGFQAGAEKLGAMVLPMGPGNTEKQLAMMMDLHTTVLGATSSYALLIAEEVNRRGIRDKINLKKGIIGSERWGDLMRQRIVQELGIQIYDIYGLTEVYGPGIGIDCDCHKGMHYWDDYLYFEIIDPKTGQVLPEGSLGELVISTFVKEAAPLVRYRTHDLTRILPGSCACGCQYPRIDRILGRTDDMIKIKGVNIYPGQIEDVIKNVKGVSSEYRIRIAHEQGKDSMTLRVESQDGADRQEVERLVGLEFKKKIGIRIDVEAVALGSLPRSEKKSTRVEDYRQA